VRLEAASQLAGLPSRLLKPYQQAQLEDALLEYRQVMAYSLDFAFAAYNLGNLHARLGEPKRAAEYYEAAIEIDDLFYPAKANLAVLYSGQGRNEDAEQLLREILETHPEQYESSYSLGLLLGEMGRYDEAATYLQQAAKGMPDRARVLYNLGLVQQYLGRYDEAEAALRRAVELEPANLDYLHALADHYLRRGDARSALFVAEQMIAVDPHNRLGQELKIISERALGRSDDR
jgi:tetratricopeptide (TPR) repeat protein